VNTVRSRLCILIATGFMLVGSGCSRTQRGEDFVPREEAAQQAVGAYLRSWSNGSTSQSVPDTNPPVLVSDELRRDGRVLKTFAILGPVPADAPVCFAVQLSLDNPPEERRERYVVVGIDPLWVWRYDDYLMVTHWSHPMPSARSSSPKR
jgi:hypothetical protein